MSKIAILSPSLSSGDAVTNDVLGMAGVLKKRNYDVRLFCESHSLRNEKVYGLSRLGGFLSAPDDVLIYHHSTGWNAGLDLLRRRNWKKIVKYHNVTPAKFFQGFSRSDETRSRMGREQLSEIVSCDCDLFLSASAFNMAELVELGAPPDKSFVVPPFHRIDHLSQIPADPAVLAKYADGKTNILNVGRVVPHKGHLTLLEAFAQYHFNYNREARLMIVGKGGEGVSDYSKLLRRAATLLGVRDSVIFSGGVSEEELKAYYEIADAFVTTSEHEGFCVPLVEAMSMKLPISAFGGAAIPETVGDAAILWSERNPLLIAETLGLLLADDHLRVALGERGRDRYQRYFTHEKIETVFMQALSHLN